MKIIFILLFFISFQFCFAQSYHAFPKSNAKWSEENYLYGALPGGESWHVYHGWSYALGNDTLIGSFHYTLVGYQATYFYQFHNSDLEFANNYPINLPGVIFGAIREDSTKKVWFKKLGSNPLMDHVCFIPSPMYADTDMLLYDFNLQVGDTLPWGPNFLNIVWKTVTGIDSVQFADGTYRKRFAFYFPVAGVEYWIEGMGSTLGLFGAYQIAPQTFDPPNSYCWLNCFWHDGEYLFKKSPFPANQTCDATTLTGIQNISNLTAPTQSFPNPFTTYTTIQFNLTSSSQTSLQVFDVNTSEIKTLLQNKNLNAGTHSVDFYAENNPAGIYYYVLRCNEKTEVGKMILVR